MSYFPIDNDQINEARQKTMTEETTKKTNYARHTQPHTEEAKKKISETQTARFDMMRELIKRSQQRQMTEQRVVEIVDEAIKKYLRANAMKVSDNKNKTVEINL